jgi:glycosyltransferase involved in cell wall biosynthesis
MPFANLAPKVPRPIFRPTPMIRTALIISPQPWEHLQISKHHYARELASCGVEVYFLDPPSSWVTALCIVDSGVPNIRVVRYPAPCYQRLRFHVRPVYDWLERGLVRRIRQAVGKPFDLVWSFDFNLFAKLRAFRGRWTIFHPVDPLCGCHHYRATVEADLVLSVSESILEPLRNIIAAAHVVPHGVAPAFAKLAAANDPWHPPTDGIKVGYTGNLTRAFIAADVILELARTYPEISFYFWGNTGGRADSIDAATFTRILDALPNCHLRGALGTEELADEMKQMDAFLLAYRTHPTESDLSNSHKLLEYLSTGRVVIASPLSEYAGAAPDVIRFAVDNDIPSFQSTFADMLSRLEELNSAALGRSRRDIALANTYRHHWECIRALLMALKPRI